MHHEDEPLAPGTELPSGLVVEWRLGDGLAGTSYRCWDPALARTVTVRRLSAAARRVWAATERTPNADQARALTGLPGIAPMFGAAESRDERFVWRSYVDGIGMRDLFARRVLPLELGATVLLGAALVLESVHALDLIHGSLCAENVFVCPGDQVVLTDAAPYAIGERTRGMWAFSGRAGAWETLRRRAAVGRRAGDPEELARFAADRLPEPRWNDTPDGTEGAPSPTYLLGCDLHALGALLRRLLDRRPRNGPEGPEVAALDHLVAVHLLTADPKRRGWIDACACTKARAPALPRLVQLLTASSVTAAERIFPEVAPPALLTGPQGLSIGGTRVEPLPRSLYISSVGMGTDTGMNEQCDAMTYPARRAQLIDASDRAFAASLEGCLAFQEQRFEHARACFRFTIGRGGAEQADQGRYNLVVTELAAERLTEAREVLGTWPPTEARRVAEILCLLRAGEVREAAALARAGLEGSDALRIGAEACRQAGDRVTAQAMDSQAHYLMTLT